MNGWILATIALGSFVAGELCMLLVVVLVDRIKAPTPGAPAHEPSEPEADTDRES
jgi:hypothetical protein